MAGEAQRTRALIQAALEGANSDKETPAAVIKHLREALMALAEQNQNPDLSKLNQPAADRFLRTLPGRKDRE